MQEIPSGRPGRDAQNSSRSTLDPDASEPSTNPHSTSRTTASGKVTSKRTHENPDTASTPDSTGSDTDSDPSSSGSDATPSANTPSTSTDTRGGGAIPTDADANHSPQPTSNG